MPPRPPDGVLAVALRQLATLSKEAPRVLIGDHPEAIHDIRVATRRLQEALAVLCVVDGHEAPLRWRRTLRRIRRALGGWRNLDVVLAEVHRRRRRTRSNDRRAAWEAVRDQLERTRIGEAAAARKRLRRADLDALCDEASGWFSVLGDGIDPGSLRSVIARRTSAGWRRWQLDMVHAMQLRTVPAVHAVRIATKRLRYRCEMAAELEPEAAQAVLPWARNMQQALGEWHDRQVLHDFIARALASPDFLLRHLEPAEILLAEIANERKRAPDPASELPRGEALEAPRAAVETLITRLSAP